MPNTLFEGYPSAYDLAMHMGPGGKKVAAMIDAMRRKNAVLNHIPWIACNNGKMHESTIITGYPKEVYGRIYKGVPPSVGTRKKVVDNCAHIPAFSSVDTRLIDSSKDPKGLRLQQDKEKISGLNLRFLKTLFYGNNIVNNDEFTGFMPRLSLSSECLPTDNDEINSYNVISAIPRGSGAAAGTPWKPDGAKYASILFVGWGNNSVHGIIPDAPGISVGIKTEDRGKQTETDEDGNKFLAYLSYYEWWHGLAMPDWHYVGRICNVDFSAAEVPDITRLMIQLYDRMINFIGDDESAELTADSKRWAIYMPTALFSKLDVQTYDSTRQSGNPAFSYKDVAGKPVIMFRGIRIYPISAMLTTEEGVPIQG